MSPAECPTAMSICVVIRPGETEFDLEERIQGSLDLPLSDLGRTQVDRMIAELEPLGLEVIYTSPSDPARSTAELIGAQLDVPVKTTDDLDNLNQGLWQGLLIDDIRRKHPKVFRQWQESPSTICPPQGETCGQADDRVRKALRKPIKKKTAIAVVASEPLATLISCIVRGEDPQLAGPCCGNGETSVHGPIIEVIEHQAKLLQPVGAK